MFAFIPAFGLSIFGAVQRLETQQADQHTNVLRQVQLMENSHAQLLAQASAFLLAVAKLIPEERQTPEQCRAAMNSLVQNFQRYDAFGMALPNGNIYCSSEPARFKNNIAHLLFFREAMATRMPAPGPYVMDPVLGKPIVYIGVPILDSARQVKAVLFAAFDLSGFTGLSSALQRPANSVVVVFDQSGLIMGRYPDPNRWTGTRKPEAALLRYATTHGAEGVADLPSLSNGERLFAYSTIHKTVDQTVFLALGIGADEVYAGARKAFRYDMLSMAVACVLVIGIVWVGSDALVIQKLRLLILTANRIRRGDLQVRSGLKVGSDEVAQLGSAIDSMAEEISRRMAALEQHGLEMRQLRDMNDALQACLAADEVYAVVRQFMQQLLPGRAGALYILDPSHDHFAVAAQWLEPSSEKEFLQNDCWAARRGKTFRVDVAAGVSIRCGHVQTPPPFNYLCVPLLVQGEILGLLHIESDRTFPATEAEPGSQSLVEAAAEHASLRLAHIRLSDHLHDQAMRDGLTNLFNRRYMEETLVREIRTAERNETIISIIMLDIDHFKHFNDSFGHAAGDALLRGIGSMLQMEMRGSDLACRYGGEEFTIILPETEVQVAMEIAEKLRRKVKLLKIQLNGASVGDVTISLGVAAFPQHGSTWEDVLHAADMALLKAKQTRDRSVIFES